MKVEIIELKSRFNNQEIILYPTIIEINKKVFLIDCGYAETYADFIRLLHQKNISVSDLYAILISHDDIDHIGALHKFKEANPGILVISSAIEEPSLSGKIKSERLEQAESSLNTFPGEYEQWALEFIKALKAIKRIPVDKKLQDGDEIENEIKAIHTPGHTKGHISFYIKNLKLLIANDAFVIENNEFNIANPQFTLDLNEAVNSIIKLETLDIEKVICYHGGEFNKNVKHEMKKLTDKYTKDTN